jgi:2-haloacid dehalogenase
VRVVTAHDWDVWGAMRAGCEAAYVARSGVPFALGRPPPIVGLALSAAAQEIMRLDEPPHER